MKGAVPRARAEIHRVVRKILEPLLSQGLITRALDAPLGPGAMAQWLVQRGLEVWGVDRDLAQSDEADPRIIRVNGDVNEALPCPDAFFDLVVSLEGIEHLENPFQFFREVARVTRPGGWLVLSTPNICNLEERLNFLFRGCFYRVIPREERERYGSGFDHQNLLTFAEIKQLLLWHHFQPLGWYRDAQKWRQLFWLWPIGLGVWLYGVCQPAARKEKYALWDSLSGPILFGGNTLIVLARRQQPKAQSQ
ncbi:class I SAM-dependent methyltransferase [Candidatus Methylacidithermus pantelleriae]|nr:class I SAM-dependent methyltransferase [Candidatus Methylacidithermus pantelleriae]